MRRKDDRREHVHAASHESMFRHRARWNTFSGRGLRAGSDETAQASPPVVRIAELEIDPAQVDAYKAALTEEVEASVRLEPGVLALNAVSINDNPTHIRLLEIYASQSAYEFRS